MFASALLNAVHWHYSLVFTVGFMFASALLNYVHLCWSLI